MSTHPTWDFKGTSTNGGYDWAMPFKFLFSSANVACN
jgi:hypothetical protein